MSRQLYGDGSIYKQTYTNKKGEQVVRYRAQIYVDDGKGGRKPKYLSARTKPEVREKLRKALQERNQGLMPGGERLTVEEYLDVWLTTTACDQVKITTFKTYKDQIRLQIAPFIGQVRLRELSPQHLRAWLQKLKGSNLAGSTRRRAFVILHSALDQATSDGLVARNVADLVDSPVAVSRKVVPFTKEQALAVLQAVRNDRWEAYYSVALAIGLRLGEALGLRWEDVDLKKGILVIKGSLQRIEGKLQVTTPKTYSSARTIHLPEVTRRALVDHRKRQLEERLFMGDRWKEQGFVFTTEIGTPIDSRNLRRHFHKMLRSIGLPELRLHDMRHTAASLMLAQGIPPKVVQEILGHSSIRVTMDTYGHLYQEELRDAADRMDRLFGPGTTAPGTSGT